MRALPRTLVAIVLVLLFGLSAVTVAQTGAGDGPLTADDVTEVFEGAWEGSCSTFGDRTTCIFQETGTEGLVQLVVRSPVPGQATMQTLEAWRAAIDEMAPGAGLSVEPAPGVGDAAVVLVDAAGVISALQFYYGGAAGTLAATGIGRTVTIGDLSDIAQRAVARIEPVVPGTSQRPVASAGTVVAPALVGLTLAQAQASIDGAGLEAQVRYDETSDQPVGTVTFQDPAAGTPMAPGDGIDIIVAGAPGTPQPQPSPAASPAAGMVLTPGFIGHDLEGATALARAFGVNLSASGVGGAQMSITDVVQSQNPAVNVPIPVGSTVTVVVAPVAAPVATPAPTPTAPPASPPVAGPVQAPGPSDISLDPVVIATSAVAAAGIVLLIPFPSALFNSTLEQNYAEVRGWFRFRRRRRATLEDGDGTSRSTDDHPDGDPTGTIDPASATGAAAASTVSALDRFWATPVGAVGFFAVAGLLYGFLDPSFGFSVDSLLLYLGILAALAVGTLASNVALRWARERLNGERGTFRVLPATLIVAVACVLLTRITDFQPGYLYGVLAGLVFATTIGTAATGREHAITSSFVAGIGVVAFLLLGIVRALQGEGGATGAWIPVDVALSALVIGGFEGLLFGMVPLTGLPGASVKQWDVRVWALLLFLGTLGFLHIIVNPSSGYLVDTTTVPMVKALALLVGFGAISVGLWAWFRYRPMDRWRERRVGSATPAGAAVVADGGATDTTADATNDDAGVSGDSGDGRD